MYFLTSHADFAYAKEAIAMGGFDYVLQPVKYREVEAVLLKAWDKISSRKKLRRLENTRKLVIEQRNTILDAMLSKMLRGKGRRLTRSIGILQRCSVWSMTTARFILFLYRS